MNELRFERHFPSSDLNQMDLAVEIRRPNLSLVQRVLASETVQLQPGTYHVFARLPSGEEVHREVSVQENVQTPPVVLAPDPVELEDAEPLSFGVFAKGGHEAFRGEDTEGPALNLAWFGGNPLAGTCVPLPDFFPEGSPRTTLVVRLEQPEPWPIVVQVIQNGLPPLNVLLPVIGFNICEVAFPRGEFGTFSVKCHPGHRTADLLLDYLVQGFLHEATTALRSNTLDMEKLLQEKDGDLVAAAVGAYGILRLGDLKRLHDWTENLKNRFHWLPDGLAIRAEYLARLGSHVEALDLLLQLPERGLPLFRTGLGYVLDRLELYATVRPGRLDAAKQAQAAVLLARLKRFARYVDFTQLCTTYTGRDPNNPDSIPTEAEPGQEPQ
jgi:hypothetical protein